MNPPFIQIYISPTPPREKKKMTSFFSFLHQLPRNFFFLGGEEDVVVVPFDARRCVFQRPESSGIPVGREKKKEKKQLKMEISSATKDLPLFSLMRISSSSSSLYIYMYKRRRRRGGKNIQLCLLGGNGKYWDGDSTIYKGCLFGDIL